MIEEKEFEGYWWRPGESNNPVGGKATFSPEEGISLHTFSSFGEGIRNMSLDASDFDKLYGMTTDGSPITLSGCTVVSPSFRSTEQGQAAPLQTRWTYLLSGHHFDDNIEFDRVRTTYPLLDSWANMSGISYSGTALEKDSVSAGDTFDIKYSFPESKSADVGDFEINLLVNASFNIGRTGSAEIEEMHYFDFIPHEGTIGVEEAIKQTGRIRDFLTLALSEKTRASKIIGRLQADQGYNDVEVYYDSQHDFKVTDSAHPKKAIFTRDDIDDVFEEVLQNWFEKDSDLENMYNLYFDSIYNDRMYIHTQILSLTQVLEAYHRKTSKDTYLPPEDYEDVYDEMVGNLPENLPQDFKDHMIHGTLKHANEYSLRKRLRDIIDQHESIFQKISIVSKDDIYDTVDARHYFTHYDESIQAISEGTELWRQTQILRIIVEVVLLSELGISEDHIVEKLERRYQERLS